MLGQVGQLRCAEPHRLLLRIDSRHANESPKRQVLTLGGVPEPVVPSVGWGVLHLFCRPSAAFDGEAVVAAVKRAQAAGDQVVTVSLLGHKADIGFMVLAEDLWRLRRLQSDLVASGFQIAGSYVSLTEVSECAAGVPDELKEARLHPQLPPKGKPAWCFYPMSKRRGARGADGHGNWFLLPFDERKDLMYAHGASRRRFAGRVLQVVTGSTGLDDFEWGVTLFANTPDDLKEVVYTMRFDEASAIYADFGPFWTGMVASVEDAIVAI